MRYNVVSPMLIVDSDPTAIENTVSATPLPSEMTGTADAEPDVTRRMRRGPAIMALPAILLSLNATMLILLNRCGKRMP